ncbi:MAG: hypothetical protein OEP95_00410, partial [Myxococcales bacterium]|nr:hypothetical protein [Myxococcales bacterium]
MKACRGFRVGGPVRAPLEETGEGFAVAADPKRPLEGFENRLAQLFVEIRTGFEAFEPLERGARLTERLAEELAEAQLENRIFGFLASQSADES